MWVSRGQNNAQSSGMTEHICHLIGQKISQFQALCGQLFSSILGFMVIYQRSRNITNNVCALFSVGRHSFCL